MQYDQASIQDDSALVDAAIHHAMAHACQRIAPLFDVRDMVAVNPFMGYTDRHFLDAALAIEEVFHTEILPEPTGLRGPRVQCVADLAQRSHPSAERVVRKSLARFLAGYFDDQQAAISSPHRGEALFEAYLSYSAHDRSPELWGFSGFRAASKAALDEPSRVTVRWLGGLDLDDAELERYFVRLLARWHGYAGLLRARGFARAATDELQQLLQVLLFLDYVLAKLLDGDLAPRFDDGEQGHREARRRQLAALDQQEESLLRSLTSNLLPCNQQGVQRPAAQLVFCIDVRSEPYRRLLEHHHEIETYGFAGFFGLPVTIDGDQGRRPHCPPLLSPSLHAHPARPQTTSRFSEWGAFVQHALGSPIASLSHVEAWGLTYLARLISNASPTATTRTPNSWRPVTLDVPLEQRVELATAILHNTSLTRPLARLVVFVGHGSHVTNNAQGAGLACGACAGHSGAPNAMLAAQLLNDPEVRSRLAETKYAVDPDVVFVAAEHDTMTDSVRLLSDAPDSHQAELEALKNKLDHTSAKRRQQRLGGNVTAQHALETLTRKANDFAETQPEWGLAGNAAFLVGSRDLSRAVPLDGRAFLHSYDGILDTDGSVLEMILTAPAIVGSWINLQYYASSVAPEVFGAGRKTLHNPSSGVGIVEGGQGDLVVGLARESLVRDGSAAHHPLRLQLLVQASPERIVSIVSRNDSIRRLVVGQWLHLHAVAQGPDGVVIQRIDEATLEQECPNAAAAE
jgi:uncharacterized protein YbcC (UPF0753/DUF2309 family)